MAFILLAIVARADDAPLSSWRFYSISVADKEWQVGAWRVQDGEVSQQCLMLVDPALDLGPKYVSIGPVGGTSSVKLKSDDHSSLTLRFDYGDVYYVTSDLSVVKILEPRIDLTNIDVLDKDTVDWETLLKTPWKTAPYGATKPAIGSLPDLPRDTPLQKSRFSPISGRKFGHR